MKITPLEIRQKSFEKVFRGYDKDEVDAFLLILSQEWEKVLDENKTLKINLDKAEKEVQKLRDVESSLFKTLKTAEDTGANLIEQASREADLHMKETGFKSDKIVAEAKTKAKEIIDSAENKSRQVLENMIDKVKEIEKQYTDIENQKEVLLTSLKGFTRELHEKLEKFEQLSDNQNFKEVIESAREIYNEGIINLPDDKNNIVEEVTIPEGTEEETVEPPEEQVEEPVEQEKEEQVEEPVEQEKEEPVKKNQEEGSFFDELD